MATLKSWREGPYGFEWEHLTPEECDKKSDEVVIQQAKLFHERTKGDVPRRFS